MQFAVSKFNPNKNGILDIGNNLKFQSKMNRPKLNLSFECVGSATDFNFAILNPACYISSVNSTIIEFGSIKNWVTLLAVSWRSPGFPDQKVREWPRVARKPGKMTVKETFLVVFGWITCGASDILTNIRRDFVGIQNKRICAIKFACITNPNVFKRDSSCIQGCAFCSISKCPIIIFIAVQVATNSSYLVNEGRCDSDTCVTRIENFMRFIKVLNYRTKCLNRWKRFLNVSRTKFR